MKVILGAGGHSKTEDRMYALQQQIGLIFHSISEVLYIPFSHSEDRWEAETADWVSSRFCGLKTIRSLHHYKREDWASVIRDSEAYFVDGGNSFRLLRMLQANDLIAPIRERVKAGAPYFGPSAGANVACPTIMTTNDMPIVWPISPDAIGLIPFQINPHYVDRDPDNPFGGESRATRIREYHEENDLPVLGLYEGSLLVISDGVLKLVFGKAILFLKDGSKREFVAPSDLTFLMSPT
ncbi:MAG: dipeptidase PepE [Candidatus Vogelbacteria bacterium CG10_big_fil_rev_8_21_14_0_10_45_14]|uniref:Dipeptidase PepE n=1 Tax=Candidatus Vogelbacteria bacterium CG10_big_fil_rev_8_21_14_0_10_45_14 TaxID=1975042 RepID=A0A2H0RKB2_9BACT|nr:MAG: dipeptidase PepE [Candidatus Vogelbacteria bacterium CG10_big_fil_rev_8_21_14_0_10_45_14]